MLKVVLDIDTGLDDAWALLVLLSQRNNVKIIGITCVNGNSSVDNVCRNTLYFLETAGGSEVPVYKGASKPLLQMEVPLPPDYKHYFGENGFGDVELPDIPLPELQEENAVVAMNRIVEENKGEIILLCLGPLTNVALAIRTYPDFAKNVKEIFVMGGNYSALGNTTMCAEFNFHVDPEAAHIVLTSFEKKLTLLPWETCYNMKIPFAWRVDNFTDQNRALSLLNKVEGPVMERGRRLGYKYWITCDQMLAGVVLMRGELVKEAFDAHAIVELAGHHTRGQIVIDHLRTRAHNITIIKRVCQDTLQDLLLSLTNYIC